MSVPRITDRSHEITDKSLQNVHQQMVQEINSALRTIQAGAVASSTVSGQQRQLQSVPQVGNETYVGVGTGAPAGGTYTDGDVVLNTSPSVGQPIGWIYESGSWQPFGNVQPGMIRDQYTGIAAGPPSNDTTHKVGDILLNSAAAVGQPVGWICTSFSTGGVTVWTALSNLGSGGMRYVSPGTSGPAADPYPLAGDVVLNSAPAVGAPIGWIYESGAWSVIGTFAKGIVRDQYTGYSITAPVSTTGYQDGDIVLNETSGSGQPIGWYLSSGTWVAFGGTRYVGTAASIPTTTTGYFNGDVVLNSSPQVGAPIGWIYESGAWSVIGTVSQGTIRDQYTGEGTASPTSGTYQVGDIVLNSGAAIGSPIGWVCTAAGTPGTWVALANMGPGSLVNRYVGSGTAAPTSGTYSAGDIVLNSAPTVQGVIGWICTVGGSPGTWTPIGTMSLFSCSGETAPTTGYHQLGEICVSTSPAYIGFPLAWLCTQSGTPGTWTVLTALTNVGGLWTSQPIIGMTPVIPSYDGGDGVTLYSQGQIMVNSIAAIGKPWGWICTVGGVPGTWRNLANIE